MKNHMHSAGYELVIRRLETSYDANMYALCSSEIWKLPCFDIEVPEACWNKWKEHYEQYRQEMTNAMSNGDVGKNEAAEEVIRKYKKVRL